MPTRIGDEVAVVLHGLGPVVHQVLIHGVGVKQWRFFKGGQQGLGDALNLISTHFKGALTAYPDSGYFEMPDWKFVDVVEPARLEQFYVLFVF